MFGSNPGASTMRTKDRRVTSVTAFSLTNPNARARKAISGKLRHGRHTRHGSLASWRPATTKGSP